MFGGGNIGRSFIGQLFSKAGYEVVFIDIDKNLINALNKERRYGVVVKRNSEQDKRIEVHNVRGVDGSDTDAVSSEIVDATIIATAVGKGAIPYISPVISQGIEKRMQSGGGGIDIIIAENVRNAARWYKDLLTQNLPYIEALDALIGCVETSIGKMVPIMTLEDKETDPLQVFAEEYNTLIVDKQGFRNGIPLVDGIKPVNNVHAYVDRKLFIHNLGHAAAAYLGFRQNPTLLYIYEHMEVPATKTAVQACMIQSAAALNREYPEDLSMVELEEHIEDLLYRFGNRELKDTVHRVGRDLQRKLGKDDRLIGSMLLAAKHNLPFNNILSAAAAAFDFKAPDETGTIFPGDIEFFESILPKGYEEVARKVCNLDPAIESEERVKQALLKNLTRA